MEKVGDPVGFDHADITIEVTCCDAAIKEKYPMRLEEMEVIIQKIVDECNHERGRPDRVLTEWRAKLEKEPTLLQPLQIDKIIRAVADRLETNDNGEFVPNADRT